MKRQRTLWAATILCSAAAIAALALGGHTPIDAAEPPTTATAPVEKSMHELMEYVFQPTYRRLKQTMSKTSEGAPDWKAVKSDALILAEGCNLLPGRGPDDETVAWNEHLAATREAGAVLYQAAKSKDADAAVTHYKTMLTRCNACHDEFADGKHQLTP